MVGEGVGRGTLYLYELVGKCEYLYVGRVIDGRTKVARAIDGRTKDVVPENQSKLPCIRGKSQASLKHFKQVS